MERVEREPRKNSETQPLYPSQRIFEDTEQIRDADSCWGLEQRKFFNVIVMGLGFMLLFTAYNTVQNLLTTLLKNLGFHNLGFWSLSILYIVVALTVFLSPVIVPKTGERLSMWIGAFCYCIYIFSLIKVIPGVVYGASVVIGFGASILWVAQGAFITKCSDDSTRGRNSGIFWGIFQMSGVVGNLGAYFLLKYDRTDRLLFVVLSGCGFAGVLVLLFLRQIKSSELSSEAAEAHKRKQHVSLLALIFDSLRMLLFNHQMHLMLVLMFYSGLELSFFSGEFPNFIHPEDRIGLVMTGFGVAEVLGGLFLGKVSDLISRKIMVICASVVYTGALVLVWFLKNHPDRIEYAYIAAVLIGIGDSTFNTQIYSALGTIFPDEDAVPAFTVFQFVQNIGSAVGFYYAAHFSAVVQLVVVLVIGWLGTLLFCFVKLQRSISSQEPLRRLVNT